MTTDTTPIRTRFAPSPTGMMHVGGVRTALFAWLFARQNGGSFILRIEDTDRKRQAPGSIEHIMESLRWLKMDWDEGPDKVGSYGPYTQSQRLDIYRHHAEQLIEKGLAYTDPYSTEELEQFRTAARMQKRPFLFRDHRPETLEVPKDWYGQKPLRFRVPELKTYEWHDTVRGQLKAGPEALDDFILIKSDGYPTYNFAHVVDDQLMGITHVMRGEEFLASVPKFLSLMDAFGWQYPAFVTLPPVLNQHGGKKLSKREGAKDVLEYRKEGYLPDAVNNFLATLGWNDGTEQEVFTTDELLKKFDINRLQRGGAKFDDERLLWLNGHHIRQRSIDELYASIEERFWPQSADTFDATYKKQVLGLVQERLKLFAELEDLTNFFFSEPDIEAETFAQEKRLKNQNREELATWIKTVLGVLENSSFAIDDLENKLRACVEETQAKTGELFMAVRIAVCGSGVAPGLFETLSLIGKERALERLKRAAQALSSESEK